MSLKANCIYLLPDGHEVVARKGILGEFQLHDPRDGVAAAPAFLVSSTGSLLSWNERTSWTRADLRETDRFVEILHLVML
jgi:hypothetical protein